MNDPKEDLFDGIQIMSPGELESSMSGETTDETTEETEETEVTEAEEIKTSRGIRGEKRSFL